MIYDIKRDGVYFFDLSDMSVHFALGGYYLEDIGYSYSNMLLEFNVILDHVEKTRKKVPSHQ